MSNDSHQPQNPPNTDGNRPLPNLEDDFWDALLPDDDHEPLPERGDFWVEQDLLDQTALIS